MLLTLFGYAALVSVSAFVLFLLSGGIDENFLKLRREERQKKAERQARVQRLARRRWPRRRCSECSTIVYASYLHYASGDW